MATKETRFQWHGIKHSKLSKETEYEKSIWHHGFYPKPTSGPQSYEEHCLWTLKSSAQHLCLPPHDHLSIWQQHHPAKSMLQVASPATWTLSHCYCQDEGSCCAVGQWHFGYPLRDSCTTLDPASARSHCQNKWELLPWDKDAERAWAVILAGVSNMRLFSYSRNMGGK